MRGVLIYNPVSGRNRERRAALVETIATALRASGYVVDLIATTHRGSAGDQARQAIVDGAEIVFACGGDGTVHDVLQGVVGTDTRLAIIPLGSANALCQELGIPSDPLRAAHAYASTQERRVAVGGCVVADGERYFLSMAGAGPDGALMYRMLTVSCSVFGRWAYAGHALRLLMRGRFRPFSVSYHSIDGTSTTVRAVSAMALRIGSLGVFPGVARGVTLNDDSMRLILVKPPALPGLLLWFLSAWLRVERWNPLLESCDVVSFTCDASDDRVHAQADGEWIGCLPMSVELRPGQTISMLLPRHS